MQLSQAVLLLAFFIATCDAVSENDIVKIPRFLHSLSHDAFAELESHLKNLVSTKGELFAKIEELNNDVPEEKRISAYDFYWSLPCVVVGPVRQLRYILENPTPALKKFAVEGLANFLNEKLTLVETCELNARALNALSAEERKIVGAEGVFECKTLGNVLKNLDLHRSLNGRYPLVLLPYDEGYCPE